MVIFALLALAMLYSETEVGEHPLAAETKIDVCGILGEESWYYLAYPAMETVVRVPESSSNTDSICALEIDPVDPSDRWGRVARGDDADRLQQIAVVSVVTTSFLRQQSPNLTTELFFNTFGEEVLAGGAERRELTGPGTRAVYYSSDEGRDMLLFEDQGIVVWLQAEGVEPANFEAFAREVASLLRQAQTES